MRARWRSFCAGLCLALGLVWPAAAQDHGPWTWSRFTYPQFSFEAPTSQPSVQTATSVPGGAPAHSLRVIGMRPDKQAVFGVSLTDLETAPLSADFQAAASRMAGGMGMEIKSVNPLSAPAGEAYEYTAANATNRLWGRAFHKDHRIIQLMVMAPAGENLEADARRFFASFHLTGP